MYRKKEVDNDGKKGKLWNEKENVFLKNDFASLYVIKKWLLSF